MASGRREPAVPSFLASNQQPAYTGRSPEPVDLFTLVRQFTALRHEVNLQTKAVRAAVEQNAEVVKRLAAADDDPDDDAEEGDAGEQLRPLLKAVIDIADALALSLRQMERFRDSVEPLVAELASGRREPAVPSDANQQPAHAGRSPGFFARRSPGFFARLFGSPPAPSPGPNPAAGKLRQLAAAAADGYALSLRRVERVLPTFDLEAVSSTGEAFDPERMEVVEVVADPAHAPGTVVEVVRPGYTWHGQPFRFAQVKVAR